MDSSLAKNPTPKTPYTDQKIGDLGLGLKPKEGGPVAELATPWLKPNILLQGERGRKEKGRRE